MVVGVIYMEVITYNKMIERKKILIGNQDVKSRSLQDFYVNINLDRSVREFIPNTYENGFDLLKQYKKERNSCRNFRVYGIINSAFVDCDNLQLIVFKKYPETINSLILSSPDYIKTINTTPLISKDWTSTNIFNKKKGKFLLELDNYTKSDYVYIYINDMQGYQNIFSQQLVFKYENLNSMYENQEIIIPYGTNEAYVDINGNIIEVNNDFDFFYNKHWVKKNITINKIRQKYWIGDESSAYCISNLTSGNLNIST
jgi:hypothetical protein